MSAIVRHLFGKRPVIGASRQHLGPNHSLLPRRWQEILRTSECEAMATPVQAILQQRSKRKYV